MRGSRKRGLLAAAVGVAALSSPAASDVVYSGTCPLGTFLTAHPNCPGPVSLSITGPSTLELQGVGIPFNTLSSVNVGVRSGGTLVTPIISVSGVSTPVSISVSGENSLITGIDSNSFAVFGGPPGNLNPQIGLNITNGGEFRFASSHFSNGEIVVSGKGSDGSSAKLSAINITLGNGPAQDTALMLRNGGLITADQFNVQSGGTLAASGTIASNVTTFFGGLIQPGGKDNYSKLNIDGNLNLMGGGTIQFDVGGSSSSYHDKIQIGGQVTLSNGSTINLNLRGSYSPKAGDRIQLFESDVLDGLSSGNGINIQFSKPVNLPYTFSNGAIIFGSTAPSSTSSSLVFRELALLQKDGSFSPQIPGFDHMGLNIDNIVYESHPGYPDGASEGQTNQFTNRSGTVVKSITNVFGVQAQHSRETFFYDAVVSEDSYVVNTAEIPISRSLGLAMRSAIQAKIANGADFYVPSSLLDFDSALQKGGGPNGAFTCVGLIEWAAEQAGLNGGEGFVPEFVESNTYLTPSLLEYAALFADVISEIKSNSGLRWLLARIDPMDFLIIDPLGRRIGHNSELGTINEIPDAYYSGDAINEFVIIPFALSGEYQFQGFGLGELGNVSVLGNSGVLYEFSGYIPAEQNFASRFFVTEVEVPEPSGIMIIGILGLFFLAHGRSIGHERKLKRMV